MKNILLIIFTAFIVRLNAAEYQFKIPTNAAQELPPGVPRQVDTNGRVVYIDGSFTTPAYQKAVLEKMIAEANQAAKDLQLPEDLPITKSNLVRAYAGQFGYNYMLRGLGNITTSNYWYNIAADYKFSDVGIAPYDTYYIKYRDPKYQLPVSQLDTNAAYQLAKQWLIAAHMDVPTLERDCLVDIKLSDHMDGKITRKKISPIYFVSWTPKDSLDKSGGAYVELYLPTKTLLQLSVKEGKYILRPPLMFTNLAEFFPGQAAIVTNYPVKPIVVGSPDDLK